MDDFAASLQQGIYNTLRANAALNSLFGGVPRVYDRIPAAKGLIFPYIRIGEDTLNENDLGCEVFIEITSRIHVFTRDVGKVLCKNMTGAIREVLKLNFIVPNYELANIEFIKTTHSTDPDGLTEHGYLEFIFTLKTP